MPAGEVLCTVRVEWDVYRTSENGLPSNRYLRSKVVKTARTWAYLAWRDAGAPRFDFPVVVRVLVYRERCLDTKNVDGGLKPLIDGVFVGRHTYAKIGGKRVEHRERAMLPDDSPRWLSWEGQPVQFWGAKYRGREQVVFEVRRRGGSG